MIDRVLITDDGYHHVKITLDGREVTKGCAGYTVERDTDGFPVLTLRYHAKSVDIDAVCEVWREVQHENA